MPKKPPRRRDMHARAANDNKRNSPPLQRYAWDVYRAAARAKWVGRVIASTVDAAIEEAAVEFKTDAWKLIAVRRFEIA
jgi:Ser/Thr protein kinase RdoA (MazF antagonist)